MLDISSLEELKFESSSRGNQRKFYHNGYWIKLDTEKCAQGLAEDFVSKFESCIVGFNFVPYESLQVLYKDDVYNACMCQNMYHAGVQFVSLRNLFRQNNVPLKVFIENESTEVNIRNVVSTVFTLTGVNISSYLRDLLFLDALIINEDRHTMNLGICFDGKSYVAAPCFDNGSSLFCVNWTYRKSKSFLENVQAAKSVARPFSKFYDKQIQALLNLGATPLRINKAAVDALLMTYMNPLYSDAQLYTIKSVLANRLEYYYRWGIFTYV